RSGAWVADWLLSSLLAFTSPSLMKRILCLAFWKWSQLSLLVLGSQLLIPAALAADEAPADAKANSSTDAKKDDKAAADSKKDEKGDEEKSKSEDKKEVEYRNWFDVSVGGAIVDGDKAAYQRRYGLPATAFGGVEDFHYEQDIGKKGIFKVDG